MPDYPDPGAPHSHDGWPPSPGFTISSNPPNPKTSFRAGDWICAEVNCSAHNFGRNSTCIGCGRQRQPTIDSARDHLRVVTTPSSLAPPMARLSPRFAAQGVGYSTPSMYADFPRTPACCAGRLRTQSSPGALSKASPLMPPPSPMPLGMLQAPGADHPMRAANPYPLLTPSGRAISVGGRVQNVSIDPLAPCIVYWPDNEPLPEQGQIRPSGSAVISYPPIINTGNKGAAEKQPGDWVCSKCHYLNWRRRKVCQTCFPYAEGNGDSISAAVQAERIALLETVLATQVEQTRMHGGGGLKPPRLESAGISFPSVDSPTAYSPISPLSPASPWHENNYTARPAFATAPGARAYPGAEGGGDRDGSLRARHTTLAQTPRTVLAGGSLLPGFLADLVHSDAPSLSPSTSTSSAELSLETDECDDRARASGGGRVPRLLGGGSRNASTASLTMHEKSIWKMDGAELGGQGKRMQPHAAGATGVQGLTAAVASLSVGAGAARRR